MKRFSINDFAKRNKENFILSPHDTVYKLIFDKSIQTWIMYKLRDHKWLYYARDNKECSHILYELISGDFKPITKAEAFIRII